MKSTKDYSALSTTVLTIPGWGDITAEQLDSPFEDDTPDPEFICVICKQSFNRLCNLKNHERTTHKNFNYGFFKNNRTFKNIDGLKHHHSLQCDDSCNRRNKRRRCDSSPPEGPSGLQLDGDGSRRKSRTALKDLEVVEIFPKATISKDFDFIKNDNNLNVLYQQYFSREKADQIFEDLEREIEYFPSELATVVVYNKRYPVPRKVSAYGDKNLTYTFSGNSLPTKPLTPTLENILKEANKFLKEGSFNYVLINRYKDGLDKIGSHKDNEKDMDPNSPIVTYSFGAERTMIFKRSHFDSVKIPLKSGSVLVMNPPTNKFWYHEIPRESKIKHVRISLTFRKNLSSSTSEKCL